MQLITFDPTKCISVLHAINVGIQTATANFSSVRFDYYGIIFLVEDDSDPNLLLREWARALLGCLGEHPVINPYPPEVLAPEELERDEQIIASIPEGLRALRSGSNYMY